MANENNLGLLDRASSMNLVVSIQLLLLLAARQSYGEPTPSASLNQSCSGHQSLDVGRLSPRPLGTSKFATVERVSVIEETIFTELGRLASMGDPVDLSSGFTNLPPPEVVVQPLRHVVAEGGDPLLHQYAGSRGHPRLLRALASLYGGLTGREIDAETEVLVTIGGTQALFLTFMGFIQPGDEVILIEPFYDPYTSMIRIAGGTIVYVPLKLKSENENLTSDDFILDPEELACKFNEKTKLIVVNTPQNPTGKVFSKHELSVIADLCQKYDVVAVMDEVYEMIVYEGKEHFRMNTLPGMWERTITIGSASKALSVTGYRVGWAYGPANLLQPLSMLLTPNVDSAPTPLQEAIAVAIEHEIPLIGKNGSYWKNLVELLKRKRDRICEFLQLAGMNPIIPDATFYVVANTSRLAENANLSQFSGSHDLKFVKWLSITQGLLGVPISSFFGEESRSGAEDYIRFTFFKKNSTLAKAEAILERLASSSDP